MKQTNSPSTGAEATASAPVGGSGASLYDAPAPVTILESELLVRGAVWDVRRDRFEFGGGVLVRDYIDHTGAVAVLALDSEDRVLLMNQYRHPIARRDVEIPAGLMDAPGESGLAGAKRELAEEADLAAGQWHLLLDLFLSPGGSSEALRVFLARDLTVTAHDFLREGEEAELQPVWVPLEEAVTAALNGQIGNAVTVSSLLAAHTAKNMGWSTLRDPQTPWEFREGVRGERSR